MFFVGQKVKLVNETFGGKILRIDPQGILVKTDHGFEHYYKPNEIVADQNARALLLSVSTQQAKEKIMFDKQSKTKKTPAQVSRTKAVEIDLHIENLLDNWHKMSNYDILQYQMRYFRNRLEKLMDQKCVKIVVIHGKGEGVLRNEIRSELLKYDNVEFLDGSYLEYGIGATEIRIRYGGR